MLAILLIFLLFVPAAAAQKHFHEATNEELVRAAVEGVTASEGEHRRFTNLFYAETIDRTLAGKEFHREARLYEETWIHDLPYQRLVEKNGKPLEGKALLKEQRLYDEAVAGRRSLDYEERIRLEGARVIRNQNDLVDVLKPIYALQELRRESSPLGEIRVVEASLRPDATGRTDCRWHYTLWIAEATFTLLHFRADAPDDPNKGCQAAFDEEYYEEIDDALHIVRAHSVIPGHSVLGTYLVEGDKRWTRYRRFRASAKIGPASVIDEPSSMPQGPPPR